MCVSVLCVKVCVWLSLKLECVLKSLREREGRERRKGKKKKVMEREEKVYLCPRIFVYALLYVCMYAA